MSTALPPTAGINGHSDPTLSTRTLDFEHLLQERYSCRSYLPTPVPRETIIDFLELAQRTASWCNSQPWHATITSGEAMQRFRSALLDRASSPTVDRNTDFPFPREYKGAYLDRRRECGFQLYESVGIARGDRAASAKQSLENFRLFGAPHLAIITTDEALGVYGAIDCGAYISNFMLAARSFGVASIAQAALATQSSFIRNYFSIPQGRMMVCGISFGFEDKRHPANSFRTRRADLNEAVTFIDD
jgi:nitroreductase